MMDADSIGSIFDPRPLVSENWGEVRERKLENEKIEMMDTRHRFLLPVAFSDIRTARIDTH